MLIKTFAHTFRDDLNKPALILKTSSATFSIKDREIIKNKIRSIVTEYKNPPSIYLLFGELSETELNGLYNHEKVKALVTFTKGEGFGRPLLEFTMTGKPVIASNWSGHKDFLPEDKSILLNGSINNVHDTVVDNFIIKESKWFTVDYDSASKRLKDIVNNYEQYVSKSNLLMSENKEKFSLEKMTDRFQSILKSAIDVPVFTKINLPKLTKVS
jgi:glycosyltransferase involved in cell wall biosynthesis